MSPSEAKQLYTAIKLHFTIDGYDAVKYNFKVRSSKISSKDSFHFERLARKYPKRETYIDFLVANFLETEKIWIGDMVSSSAHETYIAWRKQRDSFTYNFTQDVEKLFEKSIPFNNLFYARKDDYPFIISYYLQNEISFQTVAILELILNFMKNAKVTETIVWPSLSRRIYKYISFLSWVDRKKVSEIILSRFTFE